MGYHPRIEDPNLVSFLTTRCKNSELWFVNNPKLEGAILGYLAKYAERYEVKLYAYAIEGNHQHGVVAFPKMNRADFMRDLNSSIARAVPKYTKEYQGGRLWGRRYSQEFIPDNAEDIEARFFYTVLQPIQDGLVAKISEYPGYNCFHDAIHGIERKFRTVDWAKYNAAKAKNPNISIERYEVFVTLRFERLPGYESLSQKEYIKLMMKKLEKYTQKVISKRVASGLTSFVGRNNLLRVKRGSLPRDTKTSTLQSKRPRILTVCLDRWIYYMKWYLEKYFSYKHASKQFRSGNVTFRFPDGMYRPFLKFSVLSSP